MNFEMIAPKQLDTYVRDKSAFIIDLRTPDEFVERHIKGAVNIPYENLGNCYTLPQDMMIIVYCERGSISMAAARELAEKGYHVIDESTKNRYTSRPSRAPPPPSSPDW